MPLIYKARQSSLESKDGKKKWYPSLVKLGQPVSLVDMADEVSEKSSLTPGDTLSAIRNLMRVMSRHLMNSTSVRLDGLGTFTVVAHSRGNGVDDAEDVNPSQISRLRIRFTPEYTRNSFEGTTRAIFENVKFSKWGEGLDLKAIEDDDDYVDPDL